ncbi:adenosine deaminase/editase [Xylaria cf. heliscus]|nr:adenosine deaminase/editase [Xylaria cf. heliscus]
MKCLPSSKLPQARGNVLHDWHAEVLAIRAFNCFVLDECRALASGSKSSSNFIRRRSSAEMAYSSPGYVVDEPNAEEGGEEGNWHGQPFAWREDVLLHMYCSEAPCGDASMELTMASQADATPWIVPTLPPHETPSSPIATPAEPEPLLPGRAYFSQLGIVRRKPSRGDAPPTLSKSCSDKLSLHQCTSLLSSVTSLLVSPEHAYITTLILPAAQYSASGCHRAFSDGRANEGDAAVRRQKARMAPLATDPRIESRDGGYAFRPFGVETTGLEFVFSRRYTAATTTILPPSHSPTQSPPISSPFPSPTSPNPIPTSAPKIKITPSNLSTAHTASRRTETTLNGVLQGRKASAADTRGASFASRRQTWHLAVEVASLLTSTQPPGWVNAPEILEALGRGDEETEIGAETQTGAGLTYAHVKNCALLGPRRRVKEAARRVALRGWVRNEGDEGFVL